VWQREWRQIGPLPLEGEVACSRRAEALAAKLGLAGRPVPETSLVDDILDGLIRKRLEWQGYLSGVKGALPSGARWRAEGASASRGVTWRTGTNTCHLPGPLCWLLPPWRMRQPPRRQLRRASPAWRKRYEGSPLHLRPVAQPPQGRHGPAIAAAAQSTL
jgi:hypothetical protein